MLKVIEIFVTRRSRLKPEAKDIYDHIGLKELK